MGLQFFTACLCLSVILTTLSATENLNDDVELNTVLKNHNVRQVHDSHHTHGATDTHVALTVDVTRTWSFIGPRFASLAIDAGQIVHNFGNLKFTSRKLQNIAKGLNPTYFRLGGGAADSLNFVTGSRHKRQEPDRVYKPEFDMTAATWDAINNFAKIVGWDMIFNINALKRDKNDQWDPTNARTLLQYSADKHYPIVGFELGNEYDIYHHQFHYNLSASQLAKDVASFRSVLADYPLYSSAFIIGPECSRGTHTESFYGFLAAGGAKEIRAASSHHYYFQGSKGTVSMFTDPSIMDQLKEHLDIVLNETRTVDPNLPFWLSETSSAYNGGVPQIGDRYVGGFLWLDKLGVSALKGVETVIRQDFYGGHYAYINFGLAPNPDFWLTHLYKNIVGGPVFNVTHVDDNLVRAYAACTKRDSKYHFKAGSVVVYVMNLNAHQISLKVGGVMGSSIQQFSLTAGDSDGLLSQFVSINGGPKVEMNGDELPVINPVTVQSHNIVLEALSNTFLIFPDAQAVNCLMYHRS